ncbi:TlpA disulfide reductase family protein [Mucilaginibacter sp. CAU 1740]|uniref:TlpA family protein disulfide reductase n=1 Tax=Mucilaginibacter sp. CAU 1740 TaxID=3140365 RepID=UPI00325B7326
MKQILLIILFFVCLASNVNASAKPLVDTVSNRPAPKFILKDTNGKIVRLADYKGKTLVIDFWATWCIPCRKSFPAIKMVMEKYKNDPTVKFLFIDTKEVAANYKKLVRDFLADNKYDFHTVFDEKGEDGKMDLNFKKYLMPGIPAKYFIDKNGIIRYQSLGFNTALSIKESALEIKNIIEKIKKDN